MRARLPHSRRWLVVAAVVLVISATLVALATQHGSGTHGAHAGGAAIRVQGNRLVDSAGKSVRLIGVDASGTEDACVQNKGFSWSALSTGDATALATWHVNAVRVPLNEDCWLGINGAPAAYSGAAYQAAIKRWVQVLTDARMTVILDLHWSAPGQLAATAQWPMADADHSIAFWSSVARSFAPTTGVVFDTFNEPAMGAERPTASDWACWRNGCSTSYQSCRQGACTTVRYRVAGQQELVGAIRKAGAKQPIMVGGLNWAGDACGIKDTDATGQCTWLGYEPTDPDHQLIVSFHSYNWASCASTACYDQDVLPVAAVAPVVIGEFGEVDCSAQFDDQLMNWADRHDVSYLAWSWERTAASSTTCVSGPDPSTPGVGVNLQLLSSYDGTPSAIAPEAAAIRQHFLSLP